MTGPLQLQRRYSPAAAKARQALGDGSRHMRRAHSGIRIGPVQINIFFGGGVAGTGRQPGPWTLGRVIALAAGALAFGVVAGVVLLG